MIHLIAAAALMVVVILALAAGYIGWFLSHKSYSDGFLLGYGQGRQDMHDQLTAAKPTLRPVK